MDAREQMKIGDYLVTFMSEGALIEREDSSERYRVTDAAASSGVTFVRLYWKLCVAMARGDAAMLAPFNENPAGNQEDDTKKEEF